MVDEGLLHKEYIEGRKKGSLKYRLERRTNEIENSIRKFTKKNSEKNLLDIGTSDGKMLELLLKKMRFKKIVGLDLAEEVLKNKIQGVKFVQADAMSVPFKAASFDIVISTATIEHVSKPSAFCKEVNRLLSKNGIALITTPGPLFEKIATSLHYLNEDQHNFTFGKKDLIKLFEKNGFEILEYKRFMFSPIKIPLGKGAERFLSLVKLDFLFCNQLIVGRKK